mmetsp:Transcript_25497/g.33314  ORF Transcript_25497/g.33314 Transcript_25497/m.33314 type:complete len:174 (-) Transcript_25497:183-704(-)
MEGDKPNILITGTPGTGKTCTSQMIAEQLQLNHVNVGDLVRQEQCHEGKDEEFDAFILDDDKLCDVLEPLITEGGQVVDFHSCDLFPPEWFDLVLVLRTETNVLFDRLTARGYQKKKLDENMECEIMQVVLEEARETFPEEIVHEVPSNTLSDLESNIHRIKQWYTQHVQRSS